MVSIYLRCWLPSFITFASIFSIIVVKVNEFAIRGSNSTIFIFASLLFKLAKWRSLSFNPFALRKAKIVYNFGLSECNRVKSRLFYRRLLVSREVNKKMMENRGGALIDSSNRLGQSIWPIFIYQGCCIILFIAKIGDSTLTAFEEQSYLSLLCLLQNHCCNI